MEIDGHPTQDLIEELERRGGLRIVGTSEGPNADALRFVSESVGAVGGLWMFLPQEAFETGFDELL
jgi:hypothetical protein